MLPRQPYKIELLPLINTGCLFRTFFVYNIIVSFASYLVLLILVMFPSQSQYVIITAVDFVVFSL